MLPVRRTVALGDDAVLALGVLGAVLGDAARPGPGALGGPVVLDGRAQMRRTRSPGGR